MISTVRGRSWRGVARGARTVVVATIVAIVSLAATACNLDKTLSVSDVDVATIGNLFNKAGLPVLYGGALSDFQVQLTGTDASVTMPGLLTDELRDIDTFPTRIEVDQRRQTMAGAFTTNGTLQTWYRNMQRARVSLERADSAYSQFDPTHINLAEMRALNGYMYILFAEDYCNGVSVSEFNGGTNITYGPAMDKQAMLTAAIAEFDLALKQATSGQIHYLAEVGKGRALMDQGKSQYAAAAAAVKDVPVDFQYSVYNSTNSGNEQNGIFTNVGPQSKRFAVAEQDGTNGLAFRSEGRDSSTKNNPAQIGDPRVRWYLSGVGQDGSSPAYYQLKYPDWVTGLTLASGIEAKLIEAETLLNSGDASWLDTLNALRSNPNLLNKPPYTLSGQSPGGILQPLTANGTGPTQGNVDILFHERAFWLFLTGHRLGDMRRLITQYGRNAESVFPTGTYQGAAGGPMGTDVNFAIPIDEQNNPNSKGCVDRNA
jgi:hypothetical protein